MVILGMQEQENSIIEMEIKFNSVISYDTKYPYCYDTKANPIIKVKKMCKC